jgi:peroxiredoxin (alkyl hydroperoxide reductase subunit C)
MLRVGAYLPCQGINMTENSILQVGDTVPDFTLTTYEPTTKGFGEYQLSEAMKNGKWTMLFFYPADYTFV